MWLKRADCGGRRRDKRSEADEEYLGLSQAHFVYSPLAWPGASMVGAIPGPGSSEATICPAPCGGAPVAFRTQQLQQVLVKPALFHDGEQMLAVTGQ